MILSCWNKDVKHILDLADCGLSNVPLEDDLQRQTLIRDVYLFLDQNVSCMAYFMRNFNSVMSFYWALTAVVVPPSNWLDKLLKCQHFIVFVYLYTACRS
jgi:hypothetical protein